MKENQFKRYKTQRWIFLILGIVYTMLSIIFYFEGRAISYAYFIGGVLMIVFGFLDMKFVDGYKISFDSDGIKFNSPGSPILKSGRINLGWDDIKSYHIAPVRIDLKLKDESKKSIPLDALGYNDVHLVKYNFTKFAEKYLKK
jgi:hypothetical protein